MDKKTVSVQLPLAERQREIDLRLAKLAGPTKVIMGVKCRKFRASASAPKVLEDLTDCLPTERFGQETAYMDGASAAKILSNPETGPVTRLVLNTIKRQVTPKEFNRMYFYIIPQKSIQIPQRKLAHGPPDVFAHPQPPTAFCRSQL